MINNIKENELTLKLQRLGKSCAFSKEAEEYLNRNRMISKPYLIEYKGLKFIIQPNVFAPDIFEDTYFFIDQIDWSVGKRFLEIGSGAGLISVYAAKMGFSRVLATDINQDAVVNTQINSHHNNVQNIVESSQSNVFSNVPLSEKFDKIFWNLPFIWSDQTPIDALAASLYDQYYAGLQKYLKYARNYISPGGEIILGFSNSSGNFKAIEILAREYNYHYSIISEKIFDDGFNLQLIRFF